MKTNIRLQTCAYCGDLADTRDHVIPVHYAHKFKTSSRFHKGDWLVPACLECNVTLGAKIILNVPERAEYLHERYLKKWNKTLKTPYWDDDDISTLTGNFKRRMIAYQNLQKNYYQRLAHLDLVAEMAKSYLKPDR